MQMSEQQLVAELAKYPLVKKDGSLIKLLNPFLTNPFVHLLRSLLPGKPRERLAIVGLRD
jgi:hypothetical protein